MPYEMEMPESFDTGGQYLKEPGTYHFAVLAVDEAPQSNSGTLLTGFRIDAEVLAGPHAKKQVELMLFNPKMTDKNNGEMAKKKQGRFVVATGLLAAAKPGERVSVDLQKANARQFVATVDFGQKDGQPTKFLELHFADVWHVDDPSAPKHERNNAALGMIPKELRRDPKSFAPAGSAGSSASGANGNGHANGNGAGSKQPAAAAVSLEDL